MAALTIAQNTLLQEARPFPKPQPKTNYLLEYILKKYEVIDPATGTVPTVESILADQDLREILIQMGKSSSEKVSEKKPKKSSQTKAPKVSDTERNSQEYDSCRCCARIWKAEGGLGFDKIQCNSKNMVPKEKAKQMLMDLEHAPSEELVDKYLEGYNGCFCKKHMSQDLLMPNGWWLGKVNEARPEDPKLPTGSIKKGYTEEYKAHTWMYDENGEKVEKKTSRKCRTKKEKVEEKVEENVQEKVDEVEEVNAPAVEDIQPESVASKKEQQLKDEYEAWKSTQKQEKQKEEEVETDKPLDLDVSKDSSDEEEYADSEYIVDGVEYIKHWDEDDKVWIILETEEYSKIGYPCDSGIDFDNEDEERKHEARAENQ